MPTRNVNLTDALESFVLAKVESGRYENAGEVVRAALRTAIDEGDASGVAEGNPFDRVRRSLKLPRKKRQQVAAFRLSRLADAGLKGIGAYTLRTWGENQAVRYLDGLEACRQRLADDRERGGPRAPASAIGQRRKGLAALLKVGRSAPCGTLTASAPATVL
jgi:Arc/MetJ-type ribon-helix-helix transcriptional regulator